MSTLLGNSEWKEQSIYDDNYKTVEQEEISPLDDDFIREEYRQAE